MAAGERPPQVGGLAVRHFCEGDEGSVKDTHPVGPTQRSAASFPLPEHIPWPSWGNPPSGPTLGHCAHPQCLGESQYDLSTGSKV